MAARRWEACEELLRTRAPRWSTPVHKGAASVLSSQSWQSRAAVEGRVGVRGWRGRAAQLRSGLASPPPGAPRALLWGRESAAGGDLLRQLRPHGRVLRLEKLPERDRPLRIRGRVSTRTFARIGEGLGDLGEVGGKVLVCEELLDVLGHERRSTMPRNSADAHDAPSRRLPA